MKRILDEAIKPENRQALTVGLAAGTGIIVAVAATKVATLGIVGKCIVGTAIAAGTGYIVKQKLSDAALEKAHSQLMDLLNNNK